MTGRYATGTEVSPDRSRAEIEATLTKYGATAFMYGWSGGRAVLGFTANNRQVRIELKLPDPDDEQFTLTETGRDRKPSAARMAYDQAVKQRWRALALVVKAKLEAVEIGLVTFEDEFLAHIVLPGGCTVSDAVRDRVDEAYRTRTVIELLPAYPTALPTGSRP